MESVEAANNCSSIVNRNGIQLLLFLSVYTWWNRAKTINASVKLTLGVIEPEQ